MSDFLRLLIVVLAAVNPAFVAVVAPRLGRRRDWFLAVLIASAATFALSVTAAAGGEEVIDFLDVAPETFRVGAGIVMLVGGARTLVWPLAPGDDAHPPRMAEAAAGLAFPLLVTPELVAASISYGVDEGVGVTIGAVTVAMVAALVVLPAFASRPAGGWRMALSGAARLSGGVLAVMACALIVSGVRDV